MVTHILLARNSKSPPEGPWRITSDKDEVAAWLKAGGNVGLMLKENKRVVLDYDGPEHKGGRDLARNFFRKYRELCTGTIVETPSDGIHLHFSGVSQTRKILNAEGEEIGDVKASGYVVWIGSFRGKVYRILQDGPLQPFPEHLFPVPEKKEVHRQAIDENDPVRRLIRAHAWMRRREGKADGNGRGLQMIKTCRALFGMFGLTEDQVWPLILEFNERCVPPYTEKQLRHKIHDAQKGKA